MAPTRTARVSSGPHFATLRLPPHHGRGKCRKRMIVQAHRVAFSLGRKAQDAACELVGPQPLGHLRRGGGGSLTAGSISALRVTGDPAKGDPGGEAPPTPR